MIRPGPRPRRPARRMCACVCICLWTVALSVISCRAPKTIDLVDPTGVGIDYVAIVRQRADGGFISASGLIRRDRGAATYALEEDLESPSLLFVLGWLRSDLEKAAGTGLDDRVLFESKLTLKG